VLDSLVVTWGSLNMLGELCTIYNLRLGRLGTTVLLGRVFRNIFIAGILEDAADDAVQLLSNSINESIPGLGLLRRPAEGITNGILIRRLGFGARNLLRPCRP